MQLDIILPPSIELLPDGSITVDIKNEDGNIENIEYVLIVMFDNYNKISIDYFGEDGYFLLNNIVDNQGELDGCFFIKSSIVDKFNNFNLECTEETFIAKQYEIAELLGIKTIDVNKPKYLSV